MKPYDDLCLNVAMCDYLTLTSWEYDVLWTLFALPDDGTPYDMAHQRYVGQQTDSMFLGQGKVKGKEHFMLQISGSLADKLLPQSLTMENVRCTRLDVQCTTQTPFDNQLSRNLHKLSGRMLERGKTSSFMTKQGLSTCYIGAFTSQKLARVYMKDKYLLRYEMMYKKDIADPMFKKLRELPSDESWRFHITGYLKYQLLATGDDWLDSIFERHLGQVNIKPPSVPRPETKTGKWLRDAVLPAFARYAFQHDANQNILADFQKILDRVQEARYEQ